MLSLPVHRIPGGGEVGDLLLPIAGGAPVGSEARESSVARLSGAPRGVVDEAHEAERFDEAEGGVFKFPQGLIAVEQQAHFVLRVAELTRQQHPEVLNGRADSQVIEVNQMEWLAGADNDVQGVAVAVQSDVFESVELRRNGVENFARGALVFAFQTWRGEVV